MIFVRLKDWRLYDCFCQRLKEKEDLYDYICVGKLLFILFVCENCLYFELQGNVNIGLGCVLVGIVFFDFKVRISW